jgi:hypothetical protein
MTLHQLDTLIQSTHWFLNLGSAREEPGIVPLSNLEQWRQYCLTSTASEFGLRVESGVLDEFRLSGMTFLPTEIYQADPIHGE